MELLGPAMSAIGVLAVVVAAVHVGRNKSKDETIEAQQATIDSFVAGQAELRFQADERERNCEREIAQLRGRVDALAEQQTEVLAGLIAPRIAPVIIDGLVQALAQGKWRSQ